MGDNQNSYSEKIKLRGGQERDYKGSLPPMYSNSSNGCPKECITFFITILYDESTLKILNINILSMPNGLLNKVYKSDVLKAGKNPGKIRFRFSATPKFRLIKNNPSRIKVVYFDEDMDNKYKVKLKFIRAIYESQKD